MIRSIVFAALMLTLIGLSAEVCVAQGSFEGVLLMKTTNSEMKETADLIWYLKGESSRMEISSVADGHSSQYVIVADAKGMDMVSQGHVTPISAKEMRSDNATITLLEESAGGMVNGHVCTKRTYTDGKHDITYWLASGLSVRAQDLPVFLRRNMPRFDADLFPVKMEKRDVGGNVLITQDVLSIVPKTVDSGKFAR